MSRPDVESHLPLSQAQFHVLSALTEGELHGDAIVQLVQDDQRRQYYRLTGLGQLVCMAEADRLGALARRTQRNLRPGMA